MGGRVDTGRGGRERLVRCNRLMMTRDGGRNDRKRVKKRKVGKSDGETHIGG